MRFVGSARRSQDVKGGGWDERLLGSDLCGKKLLIVGFGRIGREVAQRALGFRDARVLLRHHVPKCRRWKVWNGSVRSATPCQRADVVPVHVDLNPSTVHLFDSDAFAAMNRGARQHLAGAVVDQTTLTHTLTDGRLAGAALDVLETEPPEPNDPLLALPNVVVVPTSAWRPSKRAGACSNPRSTTLPLLARRQVRQRAGLRATADAGLLMCRRRLARLHFR